MTRKDFALIAEAIRDGRENFRSNKAHVAFAYEMAAVLAQTNPLFDSARFIEACMPREWVGTRHESAWHA